MSIYLQSVPKLYRLLKYPKIFFHFCILTPIKFSAYKFAKTNIFLKIAQARGCACGRKFITDNQYNEKLKELIKSDKPFFSCRYGSTEFVSSFYGYLKRKNILDSISTEKLKKNKNQFRCFPRERGYIYPFWRSLSWVIKKCRFKLILGMCFNGRIYH